MWSRTCWWGGELGDGGGWAAWGRALIKVTQVHRGQRLPGIAEGAQKWRCLLQIFVEGLLYTRGQERKTTSSLATSFFHSQFPLCRKPRFQGCVTCPVHLSLPGVSRAEWLKVYQIQIPPTSFLTLSCLTSLSLSLSTVKWGSYNN